MDLCTKSDVKDVLDIQGDNKDTRIARLIKFVSAEIETFLDRRVTIAADILEDFDVCGGSNRFQVKGFPVTTDPVVYNDSDRSFANSTIISSSDYHFNKDRGILVVDKVGLIPGAGVLRIKYTGGMATDTDDLANKFPDLVSACAMEVAHRFQRAKEFGLVALSAGGGAITTTIKDQFNPIVLQILEKLMRVF